MNCRPPASTIRDDFDHMARVLQVDGEPDLFGDGSVVVFPTPGHTPGHQSMRVKLATRRRRAGRRLLLSQADARHAASAAFGYNGEQMLESLGLLRRLQADGARIFFGHDPEFWKTVPQAPLPVAS